MDKKNLATLLFMSIFFVSVVSTEYDAPIADPNKLKVAEYNKYDCSSPEANFNGFSVTRLEKNFTSGLERCLVIRSNRIKGIDSDAFDGLQDLKYLQIQLNRDWTSNLTLHGLSELEVLIVDSDIGLDFFCNDYGCSLNITGTFPKTTKLFLSSSHTRKLKINFAKQFPNLSYLDLSYNKIEEISSDDFPRTLTSLNLKDNPLATLRIKDLRKLRDISASRGFVQDKRSEAYVDSNLTSFQFANLRNLRYLVLAESGINELSPSNFVDLPDLIYLDLSMNYVTKLKKGVFQGNVLALEYLNLANNMIETIENGVFDDLPDLEVLDLQGNQIKEVPKFDEVLRLSELFLNSNKLEAIRSGDFSNLPLLEELHLEKNELKFAEVGAFRDLRNLKKLVLSFNQLRTFDLIPELDLATVNLADYYEQIKSKKRENYDLYKKLTIVWD